MRNKLCRLFICLFAILLVISVFPVNADETAGSKAKSLGEGIISHKLAKSESADIQSLINSHLSDNAGIESEWYILGLAQSGKNYNFSAYEKALLGYLNSNKVTSATTQQKYALALIAAGSTDTYIYTTLNNSIGKLGIMSWVYGLHMLNNGYSAEAHTVSSVKEKILSLRKSDGGWAITGNYGDVDVTAMAVQALAPYYSTDSAVKSAINTALALLSARQNTDGSFSSYGTSNAESTAQVLTALSCLNLDSATDSRFIKGGNNLIDALSLFKSGSGFSHTKGGSYNENATSQVYYALMSYTRMSENKDSIFILDNRNPTGLEIPPKNETAPETDSSIVSSASGQTASSKPQTSINTDSSSLTASAEPSSEAAASETESSDTTESSEESTETEALKKEENHSKGNDTEKPFNYKLWVSFGIALIAIIGIVLLYVLKKLTKQNVILFLGIAVILILGVYFINIGSANEHYSSSDIGDTVGTVSIAIRCDTVAGKAEHIPQNGIILEATKIEFAKSETVYDALSRAAKENKILIESTRSSGPLYVKGIANIYEFDFGDLSGWVYTVNGERPSLGCDEYTLKDGDIIEWHYSLELGEDIK